MRSLLFAQRYKATGDNVPQRDLSGNMAPLINAASGKDSDGISKILALVDQRPHNVLLSQEDHAEIEGYLFVKHTQYYDLSTLAGDGNGGLEATRGASSFKHEFSTKPSSALERSEERRVGKECRARGARCACRG